MSVNKSAYGVTQDYEKLFKRALPSKKIKMDSFGIALYKKNLDLKKWEPVYIRNGQKKFIPASITKVLTSVGLLEHFGSQKRFETKVYVDKKPQQAKLKGNLYVKGAGDPSLVSEKMWLLINEIKKWGIKKIEGDLVFDDSIFDQNYLDGDRSEWNQRAYNAPLAGLSLNWNSVRVRFLDYDSSKAVVDPFNPYFDLRVKKRPKKLSQVEIRASKDKEVLSVTVGRDARTGEKSLYRRVNDPRKYFANQFGEMLKAAGIQFSGKVKWEEVRGDKFELGKIESVPLSSLIEMMMKFSNNFIAGMLTKTIDHDFTSSPGTYRGGLAYLLANIKKVYPFPNGLSYKSSSGLSRDNNVGADDFSKFLIETRSKLYYPELLTSFPISCLDGTLKKRICRRKGLVRAKTGLLAGVAALAGYFTIPERDEDYIFTFIFNGKNGQQFDARDTFDRFLESL